MFRSGKQKTYSVNEADKIQNELIRYLIRRAKFTAFGEHYQFTAILNSGKIIEWFKGTIPVHRYHDMYIRWWYRVLNGESYVTWPGKQKYFLKFENEETGKIKTIPVSRALIRSFCKAGSRYLSAFPDNNKNNLDSEINKLRHNRIYYEGTFAGIIARHKPVKYHHCFRTTFKPAVSETQRNYFITEVGWVGIKAKNKTDEFLLIPDNGLYYEFVPNKPELFDSTYKLSGEALKTLSLKETENNVDYLLLITNNSGAWRYLTQFVISFTDKNHLMFNITGKIKTAG